MVSALGGWTIGSQPVEPNRVRVEACQDRPLSSRPDCSGNAVGLCAQYQCLLTSVVSLQSSDRRARTVTIRSPMMALPETPRLRLRQSHKFNSPPGANHKSASSIPFRVDISRLAPRSLFLIGEEQVNALYEEDPSPHATYADRCCPSTRQSILTGSRAYLCMRYYLYQSLTHMARF